MHIPTLQLFEQLTLDPSSQVIVESSHITLRQGSGQVGVQLPQLPSEQLGVQLLSNSVNDLANGIGQALVSSKNFGDAFVQAGKQILATLTAMIIKISIFKAIEAGTGGTGTFFTLARTAFGFQTPRGGARTVPGASNVAVPIVAHGGETVSRNGGGGSIIINFNGITGDPDATAQAVQDLLRDHQNRTGVFI